MQSPLRSHGSGWAGVAGAAGLLVSVLTPAGSPGTLDPNQFSMTSGTGGSGSGTGGSTGTGGSSGTCTGDNAGPAIVTTNCATTFCHIPGTKNAGVSGGLDLTVDANIGARLVGVMTVGTVDNGSACITNTIPYLNANSNPATGLLIDKVTMAHPPCGGQMPDSAPMPLSATKQSCLIEWATTLTSP